MDRQLIMCAAPQTLIGNKPKTQLDRQMTGVLAKMEVAGMACTPAVLMAHRPALTARQAAIQGGTSALCALVRGGGGVGEGRVLEDWAASSIISSALPPIPSSQHQYSKPTSPNQPWPPQLPINRACGGAGGPPLQNQQRGAAGQGALRGAPAAHAFQHR